MIVQLNIRSNDINLIDIPSVPIDKIVNIYQAGYGPHDRDYGCPDSDGPRKQGMKMRRQEG